MENIALEAEATENIVRKQGIKKEDCYHRLHES